MTATNIESEVFDIKGLALFLRVCVRSAERLIEGDPSFPRPSYVGSQRRWHRESIVAWVKAGSSSRGRGVARGGRAVVAGNCESRGGCK
jgi:hypothetical protein